MIELLFPGNLTDVEELAAHLSLMGLRRGASELWAGRFARTAEMLGVADDGPSAPVAFFVPGRLVILGKHTDYVGGRSLTAAIERGVCITATPRNDQQLVLIDANSGETLVFGLDVEQPPNEHPWARYPVRIARRLARNFPGGIRGANVAFLVDLPSGSGLCRSRALSAAVFLALAEVSNLVSRDEYWHNIGGRADLTAYLAAIESGGTFGTLTGQSELSRACRGGEDHTAILCAEPDHLSQYAYRPVEFEKAVAVPERHLFAIGCSGRSASVSDPVNDAGHVLWNQAEQLVGLWQSATGRDDEHLANALGTSPDAVERLRAIIAASGCEPATKQALNARLNHFVVESSLIPQAGDALAAGDLLAFGCLVEQSQAAFEQLLGKRMPIEIKQLVATARQFGAVAAAGFGWNGGGSVWAMIRTTRQEEFLSAWSKEYRKSCPNQAQQSSFFTTAAAPGAFRVC